MSSNPEVHSHTKHRTFTANEKVGILDAYEGAASPIERAAVMRREGVYSSLLCNWRKQLSGSGIKRRGRPANPEAAELVRLRDENAKLRRWLDKSETEDRRPGKSARAVADYCRRERGRTVAEDVVNELAEQFGVRKACAILGASKATIMRRRHPTDRPPPRKRTSHRRLTDLERQSILDVAHSQRLRGRVALGNA